MKLEGDDTSPALNEAMSQDASSCTNVKDKVPVTNVGAGYEPFGPPFTELMPTPSRTRSRGHDAPSPRSCDQDRP